MAVAATDTAQHSATTMRSALLQDTSAAINSVTRITANAQQSAPLIKAVRWLARLATATDTACKSTTSAREVFYYSPEVIFLNKQIQ